MAAVINDFLKKCAARVSGKHSNLTVVMGNEGGDMDSVVGAIYLAMLLDEHKGFHLQPAVPAVNFPLGELPLRRDVLKFFEELGIDPTALTSAHPQSSNFIDFADIRPRIVLYDHNRLKDDQSAFGELVVGVVDHHYDEKAYLDNTQNLRVIRTCGSACTLVAELYREAGVQVPCPELLLAPIVLDTVNFDDSQKKVTPEDVAAFKWLCAEGGLREYNHGDLFKKLSTWKNDIFSLTVVENLKRDYKFFAFPCSSNGGTIDCGIASVPCSYEEFVDKYGVEKVAEECEKLSATSKLNSVIIAFAGKKDGCHSRQVVFAASDPFISILSGYASSAVGDVEFTMVAERVATSGFTFKAFSLSDPTVSRKRLVPSLSQYLKDGLKSSL